MRAGRSVVLMGMALLSLTACYTYQPVRTVSVGDQARARLTVDEAVRQSEVTGEPIRDVEGRVSSVLSDRIGFDVVTARGQGLTENFQYRTTFTVPTLGIEELSLRSLSGIRTAGVTALVGGLVYLILDATVVGGGGGDDPGGSVDPADRAVRFRIGR